MPEMPEWFWRIGMSGADWEDAAEELGLAVTKRTNLGEGHPKRLDGTIDGYGVSVSWHAGGGDTGPTRWTRYRRSLLPHLGFSGLKTKRVTPPRSEKARRRKEDRYRRRGTTILADVDTWLLVSADDPGYLGIWLDEQRAEALRALCGRVHLPRVSTSTVVKNRYVEQLDEVRWAHFVVEDLRFILDQLKRLLGA